MLEVSAECARLIAEGARLHPKVEVAFPDGTAMTLSGDDVMQGGLSVTHAVSSAGSFDLGAAVMSRMTLSLNNMDGRFDGVDFDGAVMRPHVGPELSSGTVEYVPLGVFHAEMPDTLASTVKVTAVDGLSKLEVPYSAVATGYPATLEEIVSGICSTCGLSLAGAFEGGGFEVSKRPADKNLTCLQVLSYAAQASGNWARCDAEGRVSLGWYDRSAFSSEDWLDGGEFDSSTPHSTGDAADGGDFSFADEPEVDGGSLAGGFAHLHQLGSLTLKSSDVQLTGLQVVEEDKEDDGGEHSDEDIYGEELFWGLDGYVLPVVGNPLVAHGDNYPYTTVGARVIGPMVVDEGGADMDGLTFRPFDCTALADPRIEPGDAVVVTDAAQRSYRSYVTSLAFTLGAMEKLSCGAERSSKREETSTKSKSRMSQQVKAEVKAEARERKAAVSKVSGEVSSLQATVEGKASSSHTHKASDVTSGTFDAARIPNISASKITSGTLPVERGGTGAANAATARSNLGVPSITANGSAVSSISFTLDGTTLTITTGGA